MDVALDRAKADGLLKTFNQRYQYERRLARSQGRDFMGYAEAHSRLRRELYKAASGKINMQMIATALKLPTVKE